MIIEFDWAMDPSEVGPDICGICGAGFAVESVIASVLTDDRSDVGRACLACVEHLHRRNPGGFPSPMLYYRLLAQHPEPMWAGRENRICTIEERGIDYEDEMIDRSRLYGAFAS